jgi:hypothetical protein
MPSIIIEWRCPAAGSARHELIGAKQALPRRARSRASHCGMNPVFRADVGLGTRM